MGDILRNLDSVTYHAMTDRRLCEARASALRDSDILGLAMADCEAERRGFAWPDGPRVPVELACNHWQNGHFQGWCESIEIDVDDWDGLRLTGPRLRVKEGKKRIQVGRQLYPYRGSREWYGNWCWNAYGFTARGAADLLNQLKARGWTCESGDSGWFEKFNAGDVFSAYDFIEGL